MYQGYGGWNGSPWGGLGGMNPNSQGQSGQSQPQANMNQGQQPGVNPMMQQFQTQQQQQASYMGYGGTGMGTGANNMMMGNMGMMGFSGGMGGGVNSNMMGVTGGMASNSNNAGTAGNTGMLGMPGTNAHLLGMSGTIGTSGNVGMLGMGMGGMNSGNQFGINAFANHPQNQFSQQQQQNLHLQQQNSSQSMFQTQTGFARPQQPPLPPGPPPADKPFQDSSSKTPLFNNLMSSQPQPPTPVPPPPLPKDAASIQYKKPPSPPTDSRNQHNIPDHVLKLLKNAEDARILETAENCPPMTGLMSLNVSQDLFGTSSDPSKKAGIPGLDFDEGDTVRSATGSLSLALKDRFDDDVIIEENDDQLGMTNFDTVKVKSGDRKLHQKPSSEWNQFNRNNRTFRDNRQTDQIRNRGQNNSEEGHSTEIKWELRSEIEKKSTETEVGIGKNESKTSIEPRPNTNTNVGDKNNGLGKVTVGGENSNATKRPEDTSSDVSKNSLSTSNEVGSALSDSKSSNSGGVAASIPLGSGDTPIEYDRKTLKAFDKKFREWEFQFENWKSSNDNHPDQEAYKKYMDQWNLWRQQLIEQRRFILDSMSKARMEGNEIAFRKSIGQLDEDKTLSEPKSVEKSRFDNAIVSPSPQGHTGRVQPPASKIFNPPNKPSNPLNQPLLKQDESNANVQRNVNVAKSFDKGTSGQGDLQKSVQPPPLMSMSVKISDGDTREKPGIDPSNSRSDQLVERIPRDRDRPDIQSKINVDKSSFRNDGSNPNMQSNRVERISRDPQSQDKKELFKVEDHKNVNPWAQPQTNKPSANPFEVAQNEQNIFVQAASQNPWSQASAEDNLPKLSDFLQKDTFNMPNQIVRPPTQNMNPFTAGASTSGIDRFRTEGNFAADRIRRDPGMSRSKIDSLEGVTFEPNAGGMPLLTGTKQSSPVGEDKSDDLSQWFTRDRGSRYEDKESERDTNTYDNNDAPAVIDYGHGSGGANEEEDEFDIPRGERPTMRREPEGYANYEEEDDDEAKDVVTIDYGHGSIPPQVDTMHGYQAKDDYYEEEYYEEYDDYNQGYPPPPANRGRGVWGRGRGAYPENPRSMYPSYPIHGQPGRMGMQPAMRPTGRGISPTQGHKLYPNRGGGRGTVARFPVSDSSVPSEFFERPARIVPRVRPHDEPETERVESPEIIILTPPRKPRLAPPLEGVQSGDRRRIERVARDSSRGGRESSRERDIRSRRNDRSRSRSRDRDEPYRPRRDSSRDNEDTRRRVRRDESPPPRRDRDPKDRFGRTRKFSRSRSRSPTFDRVSTYRNVPGTSSSPTLNSTANPPPPKYQTVLIEDILNKPGRFKRPSQIVIILRGLPGSGKTHVAKLIKDREVENGGNAPRIISLDDYFMTEIEKVVKDPIKNVEVKETVMEYEYQPDLEFKYRNDLVKSFKKTIDQTFFPFIIVDSVNDQVKMFEHMVLYGTQKRFQVYVAEVDETVENCVKRNVHQRTKEQIQKIHKNWERTPANCVKLDIRCLLQDEAVQDVEMEDVSDTENASNDTEVMAEKKVEDDIKDKTNWEDDEPNNDESPFLVQSKWDKLEPSEEKLNRLDGLARKRTTGDEDKVDSLSVSIDSWLQSHLPEDYTSRQQTRPGQKRVRWADIEERRAQERMRDVGFVVGHTDWKRMTDPSFGSNALTKTKYI